MVKKNSKIIRVDSEDFDRIDKFKKRNDLRSNPEAIKNMIKIIEGEMSEDKRKLKIRRDIVF